METTYLIAAVSFVFGFCLGAAITVMMWKHKEAKEG